MFGALMGFGDVDEDPFFGGTMHQMSSMMNNHFNMMNSFFGGGSPFGMIESHPAMTHMMPYTGGRRMRDDYGGMGLMPMGFPNMRSVFDDMSGGNAANCHSYSQSTVMTMSSGPDGRPQVYQASSSTRQGPGGVKETRKSVADSRSGVKKMQIGHHIGERAHLIEREKNFRSGEAEERQEFINLEEEEADNFNKEWQTKATRGRSNAIGYTEHRRNYHQQPQQLALPCSSSTSSSATPSSANYSRRVARAANNSSRNKNSLSTSSRRGQEMKKKRPHEYEPENNHHYRKKNFKKNTGRTSEPIPVVEEPDSDEEEEEADESAGHHHSGGGHHSHHHTSRTIQPLSTTIIEELE